MTHSWCGRLVGVGEKVLIRRGMRIRGTQGAVGEAPTAFAV